MDIQTVQMWGKKSLWDVSPDLQVAGTVLTVKAGTFKILGVDYLLTDDATYDFSPFPAAEHFISGSLVEDKVTSAVSVLIDEVEALEEILLGIINEYDAVQDK